MVNTFGPAPMVQAQDYRLPAPGVMVHLSPPLEPPILKGIKVHPDNPFRFDFILDKGDSEFNSDQLKDESSKLIKYFLASLTIPEKDLWVNLSPYEKDRIIPNSFGLTEMGRDLLAEDYMLKQITASLIYPEDEIGKRFWKRIYEEATKKYGTTDIPVNTFNKVWIVPEKAVVYENAKAGTAYVAESKLKVMLEQDYLSLEKHEGSNAPAQGKETSQLGSDIVREVVIPELTKEVNENKNFVKLRQVYNSLILATWYKKKIKDSILSQIYTDKNKIVGVNINDPQEKQRIYERYLRAFKKGVYNYIKEDQDPVTQEGIPRKYFSGGVDMEKFGDLAMTIKPVQAENLPTEQNSKLVEIDSQVQSADNTANIAGTAGSSNGNNDSWNRRNNTVNPDDGRKRGASDQNHDFVIAGDNLGGRNRSDHVDYHRQGQFSEIISDIASQIGATVRTDGLYDLRSVVANAPGRRITTSHGEIYLTEDGILVIIDSRFQRDHAGRGERAIYAKNASKVKHELVELKGWIEFAVKKGLVTEEEVLNGQVDLGRILRNYMNGVGENLTVDQLVSRREEIFQHRDRLHRQGIEAERAERGLVHPESRGSLEGTLYRGTTRAQWAQILRGETPQSEYSTNGLTWVTLDLESATAYSRREGEAQAVIIAYKLSANGKVSTLTSYGDLRRQGVLSLEDVARVYDLKGNVLYDAENQIPSTLGEGSDLDFIISSDGDYRLGGEDLGDSFQHMFTVEGRRVSVDDLQRALVAVNDEIVASNEQILRYIEDFNSGDRYIRPRMQLGEQGQILPDRASSFKDALAQSMVGRLLLLTSKLFPVQEDSLFKGRKQGLDSDDVVNLLWEKAKKHDNFSDFIMTLSQEIQTISGVDLTHSNDINNLLISTGSEDLFNAIVSYIINNFIRPELQSRPYPTSFVSSMTWEGFIQARRTSLRGQGRPFRAPPGPWSENNLHIGNGFWQSGPEGALGLVSRGIHGGLNKVLTSDGLMAADVQGNNLPFRSMSFSSTPYGGVGWGEGQIVFYCDPAKMPIANENELQQLRKTLGLGHTPYNDGSEVVAKNTVPLDAVQWVFVDTNQYLTNEQLLNEPWIKDKVVVFGISRSQGFYYYHLNDADNKIILTSLERFYGQNSDKADPDIAFEIASQLAITDVTKKEYLQQEIAGKSRQVRILEAADKISREDAVFSPKAIAHLLKEDIDIVIDVLINANKYSVARSDIIYNGRRDIMFKLARNSQPLASWDILSRELTNKESAQWKTTRILQDSWRRLGLSREEMNVAQNNASSNRQTSPLMGNPLDSNGDKAIKGGIDLTPANMNLQTRNSNGEIKFHMDPAMLQQLQNAPGFVPVIINIQPLKSLPEFLGLNRNTASSNSLTKNIV